jgi:hypothetical protein
MSEQLHEAAERARLERRRRLVAEVAPYLSPGERVLEATTGKGAAHGAGERPRDPAALRVVVTDRRLILLRKKAFRQFAVQEFSFASSRVWLGFTAEAGGEVEVSDTAHRTHVSLAGVPELDLEPLYLALRERMAPDQLDVWLDPPPAEAPSIVLTDVDDLAMAEEPAVADVIELPEAEPEPVRVGGSTIEEILLAAGFPPESVEGPTAVPSMHLGHASSAGEGGGSTGGGAPVDGPAVGGFSREPMADAPVIIPDVDSDFGPGEAGGAVQSGILRWLLATTGADAALYLRRGARGEEHLQVEPRRLDAGTAMSLVRRATEASSGSLPPPDAGDDLQVSRWGASGEERVLVLSNAGSGAGDVTSFARFVLERLESTAEAAPGPARGADRPELVDVVVSVDDDGRPAAEVRLSWRGQELSGSGHGHTAILGRHLAVARAVVDALRALVPGDLVVEHVLLSYPPIDAELVVATILVGARRFVGATAADPGDEETAAARAVLDALNRHLGDFASP